MLYYCHRVYLGFVVSCTRCIFMIFFFFKQKTAYEMRISDWSSDVCSSDLPLVAAVFTGAEIAASPDPAGLADTWPLIMRAKASYYPGRSGDLVEIGRASCRERVCQYV